MRLDDYLDAAETAPWSWGQADCCFFAGDWIALATGRDPLGPYRGTYDTARGAARFVSAGQGLAATVGAEMARCGFAVVTDPEHGDIAVVEMPGDGEHAAARASVVIRNGPWWVGKALDGVTWFRAEPVAAWRVL